MEDKERLDKVYAKMFESNGEESVVSILHSHDEEIREAKIEAGEAKITANRVRKYCGLEYQNNGGEEGVCIMSEVVSFITFIKRIWKPVIFLAAFLFLLVFGMSAWNGWTLHNQMKETVKEFKELREIIVK